MKQLLCLAALGLTLALSSAHAADEKAPTKQQSRMATCNKDATGMKGDERKAFMKQCLSNKAPAAAGTEQAAKPAAAGQQQARMKTCNADAKSKNLKGDERKAFMSECLKSS